MGDWVGLAVVAAIVVACVLARRRVRAQTSMAMAAVKLEGFEAGRAAVLASIGSTVVVNTSVGNGGGVSAPGDESADVARDAIRMVLGGAENIGLHGDLSRGVPVGRHDGDPRLHRIEALSDVPRVLRREMNTARELGE